MINEQKIKELEKQLSSPTYSTSLPDSSPNKPDLIKLRKLAKEIRKTVEDYTVENSTYPLAGNGS